MQIVFIENGRLNKEKATLWLMGIIFVCFWFQWVLNEHFVKKLFLSKFSLVQLISHQFLHVHSVHLIINLGLLYLFGKIVETRLGASVLYVSFILCGVLAGISHLLFSGHVAGGASGAISGLIGLSLIFDYRSKVYFFDRMFRVPVWLMAVLWVVKDFFALGIPALRTGPAGHLGGFTAGVLLGFMIIELKKRWLVSDT
jgi:membrane associated rhomboid family serine protease